MFPYLNIDSLLYKVSPYFNVLISNNVYIFLWINTGKNLFDMQNAIGLISKVK